MDPHYWMAWPSPALITAISCYEIIIPDMGYIDKTYGAQIQIPIADGPNNSSH